ncbi:MAG: isoleucine--tRNA ligase [Hyphomicrobiaceae bacterium]|nr:isoleucine--tRNA ligase [Hyphomicrobiaceae bacterium]
MTKSNANDGAAKHGGARGQESAADAGRDWGSTLFLPKTDFPMRAGLPQMEPKLIERWKTIDLYSKLRAQSKGRARFTLHDGPPYANGNIHIGHALNKILKDLVTRSQQMLGFDSNYVPGWDCHGLPIEWKIEEEYMAKGKAKPNLKDPAAMKAFRAECRSFAEHWMQVQSAEFQRLGVEGDWKHPYTTMTFPAEAQIARELMKFAETGQLYRGSKPVMWSVVEKTALAEAEVEYQDYQSDMVWVKFPVSGFGVGKSPALAESEAMDLFRGASVVIWTTTPWTIPGNRAICYNSKLAYGLYRVAKSPEGNWAKVGDKYILANRLAEEVMKAAKVDQFEKLADLREVQFELSAVNCTHPLRGHGYEFFVPLLDGDHVTDDAGTGFVHTAPGHGREDFDIWTASTRKLIAMGVDPTIPYTVDENGAYTKDAPGFEGERVITDKGEKGKANDAVIKKLAEAGMLVARGRLKHQYPHSWRSKKPVIFRNTPQWFIHMDKEVPFLEQVSREHREKLRAAGLTDGHNAPIPKTLREVSLQAIRETEWVPASGENRIGGMIEAKPDWVISRQRAWGVPITVFVRKGTNELLVDPRVNKRIYDAMHAEGADAWFADADGARFLKPDYDPADFEKVNDVLDVWFDSGSTHTYVLEDKDHFPGLYGFKRKVDGGRDTVMYLEGSDQHRGWFHSSLIESCGTRGRAPYDVVLTHGFCLDEKGQKMSKSVGNVTAPQDVIKASGADILRLWVASSDYADDLRIGPEILKTFSDNYRKIRNTLRWMLGTLAHYPSSSLAPSDAHFASGAAPSDAGFSVAPSGAHTAPGAASGVGPGAGVTVKDMPELERLMLHRLAELDLIVRKAYAEYDYKRVVAQLSQFMNTELSAFYFDIRKDALYCEAPSSRKRLAALACVEQIFRCTTVWLAPILAFTTEEAWLARYGSDGGRSVHLETFPEIPAHWRDDALDARWGKVRRVRSVVTGALEIERAAKRMGSSLEAAPLVYVADADLADLLAGVDLAEICITSGIGITVDEAPAGAFTLPEAPDVAVLPQRAAGSKCARSWRFTTDVGSDPDYPELSARDAAAMREIDARAA